MITDIKKLPFRLDGKSVGMEQIYSIPIGGFSNFRNTINESYILTGFEFKHVPFLNKYKIVECVMSMEDTCFYREHIVIGLNSWNKNESEMYPVLTKLYYKDKDDKISNSVLLMRKGISNIQKIVGYHPDCVSIANILYKSVVKELETADEDPSLIEQVKYKEYELNKLCNYFHNENSGIYDIDIPTVCSDIVDAWIIENKADLSRGFVVSNITDMFFPKIIPSIDPMTFRLSQGHTTNKWINKFVSPHTNIHKSKCQIKELNSSKFIEYNPFVYDGGYNLYELIQNSEFTDIHLEYILSERGCILNKDSVILGNGYFNKWYKADEAKSIIEEIAIQIMCLADSYCSAAKYHKSIIKLEDNEMTVCLYTDNEVDVIYFDMVILAVCSNVFTKI